MPATQVGEHFIAEALLRDVSMGSTRSPCVEDVGLSTESVLMCTDARSLVCHTWASARESLRSRFTVLLPIMRYRKVCRLQTANCPSLNLSHAVVCPSA